MPNKNRITNNYARDEGIEEDRGCSDATFVKKGSACELVQGAVPRQRHDDVCLTTLRARPQAGAVKGGG